jgi:crotonobetainyl-CoA:carnitine CoA-transferase CaiB-like acyl-CoA transferase
MGWIVSNYLIAGQQPVPMGNDNFTAAPSGAFRTRDGLINIAANKQEQFVALMEVIGREELVADPRFAHREERKRHRSDLTAEVESALAGRSAAQWEPLLNAAGVPAGRVLGVPDALSLEQVQQRGLVEQFADCDILGKPLALITAGYKLGDGARRLHSPPPRLGEHTEEVLGELGYSSEQIAELRAGSSI